MTHVEVPPYALGHSFEELERLVAQASFIDDLTEHVLRLAGVSAGMRVLDIGCGAGDVAFLAARLVGPYGAVIGVDRATDAIEVARARARSDGLTNVEFRVADAGDVLLEEPVDALVGRLIMMYFADPAATMRRLLPNVRSGGVVVFQEFHLEARASEPTCPAYEAAVDRAARTLSRVGGDPRAGLKLWHTFRDAGLAAPSMLQQARVEAGLDSPIYAQVAHITRTLLPLMERTGIATAAEVAIDTLADHLRAEAVQRNAELVFPPLISAWTRVADRRSTS